MTESQSSQRVDYSITSFIGETNSNIREGLAIADNTTRYNYENIHVYLGILVENIEVYLIYVYKMIG